MTDGIAAVTGQLDRLDGWLRAAEDELDGRTGGRLPTDDGGSRSVAGWLADVRHDSASDGDGQAQRLESLSGVTAAMRRLLAVRDLGCTDRRCTVPPACCDAHHLVRSADGGLTVVELVLL